MTRTIDVHNHLYPKVWLDFLEKRGNSPRMERVGQRMFLYSHEIHGSSIDNPGHYDPGLRIEDMDKCGIDVQMLSITVPSVEELPAQEGAAWASRINDYFIETCRKYPGRFYAYVTLPYQDVDAAVKELERMHQVPEMRGIMMFSNVNFKPISLPEFYPIYAKAEEYDLPIFIHPAVPFTSEIMDKHRLIVPLYGFTLDTTMAIMSLIWQGVLERYPGMKIIHAHLGGVVPYLVQRMEDCWNASHKRTGLELREAPSEYYKRQVYPDSMSAYLPAMRCCLEFVGPEHICLGTDYPHNIGNWEQAIDIVQRLQLSEKETSDILGGNAARLFKIE